MYRAKWDLAHKLLDFGHKIISPGTYECDLCALTYGYVGMKQEWAEYVDALRGKGIVVSFCYEEQARWYGYNPDDLPAVALQENWWTPQTLVSREMFTTLKTISDLKNTITSRIV